MNVSKRKIKPARPAIPGDTTGTSLFNKSKEKEKKYYVFILTGRSKSLHIGVTDNISREIYENKKRALPGFTKWNKNTKLVFFELYNSIEEATAREKELKGWMRKKKIALVESLNYGWKDLSEGWVE